MVRKEWTNRENRHLLTGGGPFYPASLIHPGSYSWLKPLLHRRHLSNAVGTASAANESNQPRDQVQNMSHFFSIDDRESIQQTSCC